MNNIIKYFSQTSILEANWFWNFLFSKTKHFQACRTRIVGNAIRRRYNTFHKVGCRLQVVIKPGTCNSQAATNIQRLFSSFLWIILLPTIFTGCYHRENYPLVIPLHFPQPTIPEDNELTNARVELGQKLFFDQNISLDSTISCKSCHMPGMAFADFRAISTGIKGRKGKRNAPSLFNVAYLNLINKDGGVKSLDLQALVPIEDENEMGISIVELSERLNRDPEYASLSQKAYGRNPDAFVVTRALASFVRTLYSGNSAYDKFIIGDSMALEPDQLKGMKLFFNDRLNCSSCHKGVLFTNNTFENNGLYQEYIDVGRALITLDSADTGKFRVPSLRNVAVTEPYMHDGSINDLESVIDHYSSLSRKQYPLISDKIVEFDLSPDEKEALIRFLEALTEEEFR